jgi:hypothetical protein
MSSPSTYNEGMSPVDYATDGDNGDDMGSELAKRNMQVKVLYSFDSRGENNCLARLPGMWPIPVVSMTDPNSGVTTEIGVIELKTCIQAIVQSRFVFGIQSHD